MFPASQIWEFASNVWFIKPSNKRNGVKSIKWHEKYFKYEHLKAARVYSGFDGDNFTVK